MFDLNALPPERKFRDATPEELRAFGRGWKEFLMPQVIIRRETDGREYEISTADYRRGKHFLNEKGELQTYEAAGFEIVSLADGTAYEAPAERHAPSAPAHGEHAT